MPTIQEPAATGEKQPLPVGEREASEIPFVVRRPWCDLRWWSLVFVFVTFLSWIFLYFHEGALIVQLVQVIVAGLGAVGVKMLYDQHRQVKK